jgi:predicted outer membrane repeat protein
MATASPIRRSAWLAIAVGLLVATHATPASAAESCDATDEASYRQCITDFNGSADPGPYVLNIENSFSMTDDTDPLYTRAVDLTIRSLGSMHTISSDGSSRFFDTSHGSLVTIERLRLVGFTPPVGQTAGGAIRVANGELKIDRSTFEGNYASTNGGAIRTTAATLTVTDSTFYDNSTDSYGGAVAYENGTSLTITNSTFYDNTSNTSIVSVFTNAAGAMVVDLTNVTITGNGANADDLNIHSIGGPITATLHGVVLSGSGCFHATASLTAEYSWANDVSCFADGGTNTIGADPMLGAFADNGGETFTLVPLQDSPLVDAIPSIDCAGLMFDQRGVDRPQGDGCDIGAVERGDDPTPTVGLFDPSQGQWHLRNSTGAVTSFYFGNPGDYPIMGDWDCDGIDTVGMYRQSNGLVYLRNSNSQGTHHIRFFFGNPGDIPIVGDFNNNGCDTVSIYRPSNQTFYIINTLGANDGGLGAAQFSYVFGNPGDKPFTGDFNGNGTDTVGLHRETTGLVYFRNSHTQGNADAQFFFGNPNDRFITGDWNANGIDSPGIFRPGSTTFYFRFTNTQGNADAQFQWGQSGWLPVSGMFGLGQKPGLRE